MSMMEPPVGANVARRFSFRGVEARGNESTGRPLSTVMSQRSFSVVPDLGVFRLVCTYCARSLRPLEIVETPVFGDGWFAGDLQQRRARATVPGCADCAVELVALQERLLAAWSDAPEEAAVDSLDMRRWTDRLVRALHRVELHALLPRHARIDCVRLSEQRDVTRLDCTLEFEYRLPAPGLAYWFASPMTREGGSVWFVSIRRRVVLCAVVPSQ
jgi:hypothetical protein